MSEEQPYQEIRQVYKDLTQTVEREKSGNRAWGRYGLGEQEYSNTFRIVSELPPLQRLAKQKTIENELKEIEAA